MWCDAATREVSLAHHLDCCGILHGEEEFVWMNLRSSSKIESPLLSTIQRNQPNEVLEFIRWQTQVPV